MLALLSLCKKWVIFYSRKHLPPPPPPRIIQWATFEIAHNCNPRLQGIVLQSLPSFQLTSKICWCSGLLKAADLRSCRFGTAASYWLDDHVSDPSLETRQLNTQLNQTQINFVRWMFSSTNRSPSQTSIWNELQWQLLWLCSSLSGY